MQKIISHILAPVGKGKQSELVADRALRMANHFQCGLHLLYAHNGINQLLGALNGHDKSVSKRIACLEEKYAPLLNTGLTFKVSACKGDIEQQVTEYAIRHFIDLIIVGKSGNSLPGSLFGSLSINRLARRTKSAVLTIDSKPVQLDKVQNIVLPVAAHLPIRKIMMASYVAKKYNARIHLIGLTRRYPVATVEDALYLYKTFQLLRDNTNLDVEYHLLPGENIADKTLEYAQDIKADLIVVDPGKELLLSGFINKVFARFIFNESPIPVMTINAATE